MSFPNDRTYTPDINLFLSDNAAAYTASGYLQVGGVNSILDPGGNPGTTTGSGAEFGTVDKSGNVFAGEPRPRILRKYVKVR